MGLGSTQRRYLGNGDHYIRLSRHGVAQVANNRAHDAAGEAHGNDQVCNARRALIGPPPVPRARPPQSAPARRGVGPTAASGSSAPLRVHCGTSGCRPAGLSTGVWLAGARAHHGGRVRVHRARARCNERKRRGRRAFSRCTYRQQRACCRAAAHPMRNVRFCNHATGSCNRS